MHACKYVCVLVYVCGCKCVRLSICLCACVCQREGIVTHIICLCVCVCVSERGHSNTYIAFPGWDINWFKSIMFPLLHATKNLMANFQSIHIRKCIHTIHTYVCMSVLLITSGHQTFPVTNKIEYFSFKS